MKTDIDERIEKLQQHKSVLASKSLQKQIAGLRNAVKRSEKIANKYCRAFCLTMDGIEPEEAEYIVGLRKKED